MKSTTSMEIKILIQKAQEARKINKKGGNWKFSEEYKAACLTLSNSNLNAKRGEGAGGYPIAVCSDPLTTSNN